MTRYLAPHALLPDGWADGVVLEVGADGLLAQVEAGCTGSGSEALVRLPGPVVPGVVNAHSHAFQRALAGGAEVRGRVEDSFWGWRTALYDLALRLDPDQVQVVARQLYTELLESGYTRVVEFHYLHHAPTGVPYADPLEMSRRLEAASRETGIGLTLLPVLYQHGDFGGAPPGPGQRRFVTSTEDFLGMVSALASRDPAHEIPVRVGLAFHSLRAVGPRAMAEVLHGVPGDFPVHLHAAEQPAEVEGCLEWSGRRSVEWVVGELPLDRRWSLVHCTQVEPFEIRALAASEATVVLCPTTEANLGDGVFPLPALMESGGTIAVGSDSHVSTSPVEELRWLEYGQRLRTGRRTLGATARHPATGRALLEAVWSGGARAAGVEAGALRPGLRADWLVLDPDHPILAGRAGDGVLDAWVFSGNRPPLLEVWVGGRRVVSEGRHPRREQHARAFRRVMRDLLAG
jgi:formimidoylglutamate deiminase